MKILISAYACSPFQGSEASVGWGFVSELSKYHDLTVFVEEEKFRNDIESYLKSNNNSSKKIKFIFVKKKRNRWLRKIWPPSYYKYYKEWHKNVFNIARDLHSLERFDLAHQLTMVGFREPGYLWKLDVPFVWGPVGGMGYFPKQFLFHIGFKGFVYYLAYNFYNYVHMNFLIRSKVAAKKASIALISATSDNRRSIKSSWSYNSAVISEVGIPHSINNIDLFKSQESHPLRIVWSGQHTPGKALNIGLRAVSLLPKEIDWELHILGSGELTNKWKKYAESLNISKNCKFYGAVDRRIALDIMATSNLMLITSLRDLTSAVTIESISLGLPVICLDHCGFSDVVDETCGIKVSLTDFNQVTSDMSAAIEKLAVDEKYLTELSLGALKKAEMFSWSNKVSALNEIYTKKLNEFNANI